MNLGAHPGSQGPAMAPGAAVKVSTGLAASSRPPSPTRVCTVEGRAGFGAGWGSAGGRLGVCLDLEAAHHRQAELAGPRDLSHRGRGRSRDLVLTPPGRVLGSPVLGPLLDVASAAELVPWPLPHPHRGQHALERTGTRGGGSCFGCFFCPGSFMGGS